MLKLTLVWRVFWLYMQFCGRMGPRAWDFCNYKESDGAQASSSFGGVQGERGPAVVETLRLVINKINQSGAAISSARLDWIIVFL